MARVHILDDELINKIAAGEVVERPASVVKELVENAIDAGSNHVRVILKEGGRSLIQVSDDGFGMEPEDAVLALRRHTTSKLARADDLFAVSTMGFRGEALASISSVSRFTLQSQARESASGVRVTLEEGQVKSVPWSGAYGTSITVADLFYNVPARKNFLKTAAAEFAACHEYMQALALSMPHIGFSLVHNDREIFSVQALPLKDTGWRGEAALRRRAEALFGDEFVGSLLYVAKVDRFARIEGLLSAPGQDKTSARYLFTFVNQRWVRDKTLRYGILRGYHSHLLKGKFPIAFVHLDIDAALVDVNVHPAKAELRFQYGSEVQNALATAIREALRQGAWTEAPVSVSEPEESIPAQEAQAPRPASNEPVAEARVREVSRTTLPQDFDLLLGREHTTPTQALDSFPAAARTVDRESSAPRAPTAVEAAPARSVSTSRASAEAPPPREIRETRMSFDRREAIPQVAVPSKPASQLFEALLSTAGPEPTPVASKGPQSAQGPSGETIPWEELNFVGAFARCFLFFEYNDQLLAVDQHAFHERVLYERLLANPALLKSSQPLLMPEALVFRPSEVVELAQKQEHFAGLGLRYRVLNETEVEVEAVPSLLVNKDLGTVMQALLSGVQQSGELLHDHLATIACHAAVRAGEDLPEPELRSLLREAQTVDFYHNCPHGRRVFRWWKLSQVAAWFDRLG